MDTEELSTEDEDIYGRMLCGIIALFFLTLPTGLYLIEATFPKTIIYAILYLVVQFGSPPLCILFLLVVPGDLSPRYVDTYAVFGTILISLGSINLYLLGRHQHLPPFDILFYLLLFYFFAPSIVTILVGVRLFAYSLHKKMKMRELKRQLSSGVITQEEYEQKRKKLLEKQGMHKVTLLKLMHIHGFNYIGS